jgi:hypothetical protein
MSPHRGIQLTASESEITKSIVTTLNNDTVAVARIERSPTL